MFLTLLAAPEDVDNRLLLTAHTTHPFIILGLAVGLEYLTSSIEDNATNRSKEAQGGQMQQP